MQQKKSKNRLGETLFSYIVSHIAPQHHQKNILGYVMKNDKLFHVENKTLFNVGRF